MKTKRKLRTKLTVLFTVFALLLGVFISVFSYRITRDLATNMYSEKAQRTAALVATFVDGDSVGRYLQTLEKDAQYEALRKQLNTVKEKLDLLYLYVFVPGEDSFTYLVDAQTPTDDPDFISDLGDVYEYTELEYQRLVPDVQAKRASTDVITTENPVFGRGVSAWAPVLDSQGELAAMVEVDFALQQVLDSITRSMMIFLGGFGILILVMIVSQATAVQKMITVPLQKLTDRTLRFASRGELSDFVDDVRTGDELQTLSEAFRQMAEDITAYTREQADVAASQERIATELQVATRMQQSMLPQELPNFPGRKYLDVLGKIRTSPKMGGNFYDYFVLNPHRVGIVLCGVRDTGVTAAMLLVVTRTIIKSQFLSERSLADTMSAVNWQIYESLNGEQPIPAFVGILDTEEGIFSYINAGYNAPVRMRPGERYELLTSAAYEPLGISRNVVYRELKLELRQGDQLLFYSDGVIQAQSSAGDAYGTERLRSSLNEHRNQDLSPEMLLDAIFQSVLTFTGKSMPDDDLVLLSLTYKRGNRDQAWLVLPPEMNRVHALQEFLKEQMAANRIEGKDYAHILVCAEEIFSICCSYAAVDRAEPAPRVEVDCVVPTPEQLVLRFHVKLRDGDPLSDEKNTVVQNAIDFIRRNSESFELIRMEGKSALVMTRRLSKPAVTAAEKAAV